jgi:hypothetical protein
VWHLPTELGGSSLNLLLRSQKLSQDNLALVYMSSITRTQISIVEKFEHCCSSTVISVVWHLCDLLIDAYFIKMHRCG